jgi:competence protein ComEA
VSGIRERLDSLSRGELMGLALVLVATLGGAALWYTRSLPRAVQVAATPANAAPGAFVQPQPSPMFPAATPFGSVAPVAVGASGGATASGSTTAPSPAVLIVDVAGWVRKPGVYEFHQGDRIVDAVDRAGGARDGANLTLLNLAAPLADGQQVLVPKKGQALPTAAGAGTTSGTTAGTTGITATTGTAPIDVNTADSVALETLNGIGEALAAAIIQFRTQNGPFTSVDQLDEVSGIGPATLEKIRPYVTV